MSIENAEHGAPPPAQPRISTESLPPMFRAERTWCQYIERKIKVGRCARGVVSWIVVMGLSRHEDFQSSCRIETMCHDWSLLVSIQAFDGGLSRSILPIRTHSDIWFFQSTFKAASISGQLPFSSIRGGICSAQVQAQEGLSMNSLKRHKHAVLLVALIW